MSLARRQLLHLGFVSATIAAGTLPIRGMVSALTSRPAATPPVAAIKTAQLRPALTVTAPAKPPAAPAVARKLAARLVRRAHVHNLHTGEVLDTVYFEDGKYLPGALAEARRVLRDWRNGEEHAMDCRLFDLLHAVSAKLEATAPFQILSGYRSKATNAMLHEHSDQVASHSQHMLGRALDVFLPGVALTHLREAALSLRAGGVGFYPRSNFVHLDVGPVRQWAGT